MNGKKVLLFAPFGLWTVHHQVDAVLGAALHARGCDARVVSCDGVFTDCLIAGKSPSKEACRNCTAMGEKLFASFKLPILQIRSFLEEKDFRECREWAHGVPPEASVEAIFEGWEIGQWASLDVHSRFTTGRHDFSNPDVVATYQNFLYAGALLQRACSRMLDRFRPDHLICYSGLKLYYRVVFELSRHRGIPVLIHERGGVSDTFLFLDNNTMGMHEHRTRVWKDWKNVPLDSHELDWVNTYINDREKGKNTNLRLPYTYTSAGKNVRKMLRIPANSKIIAIFTSNDWEYARLKPHTPMLFDSQIEGVQYIADHLRGSDVYLVVRLHPPMGYSCLTHGPDFLRKFLDFSRTLPDNVRVVMPNERVTSYSILWNATVVATFGSTLGIEALFRGVPSVSAIENICSIVVPKAESRHELIDTIQEAVHGRLGFNVDDLKLVYRAVYYMYRRVNFQFKSFGIRDFCNPDIRIKTFDQLREGVDPMLDHICGHILCGTPLYPLPNQDVKQRFAREETEYIEKELEGIKGKRTRIKEYAMVNKDYHEPLITVVRMRQNGMKAPGDTTFSQTIKRSRYTNIELLPNSEMVFPMQAYGMLDSDYCSSKAFFEELTAATTRAAGEFIYFGTDNTHVDESFFSTCVDFLVEQENTGYDGIITGAWICDEKSKVTDELFTGQKQVIDYHTARHVLPSITNPPQLLTFFLWRKSSLLRFLLELRKTETPLDDVSLFLYETLFPEDSIYRLRKIPTPMITIYIPSPANELFSQGVDLFNKEKWQEALQQFEKAMDDDESVPGLDYYRALTKAKLGNTWEAIVVAEAGAARTPKDERITGLAEELTAALAGQKPQHADFAASIESVEGWLAPGQEKYLFQKVQSLSKEAVVLEIGACYGRSAAAMGFACVGTNRRIFSIDTFLGNVGGGTRTQGNSFFDVWEANIRRLGLEKWITPLPGFSHERIARWGDKPRLDFVFIDASHHYVDVIKDFELVYPLVKDGGWIAFHDVEPGWPGPWRVWRETAMPLLSSHEYCSNLACGRKEAGKPFVLTSDEDSFSYSKEWAEYLVQSAPELSKAMMISMENGKGSGADDSELERAEQIISLISDHAFLKNPLREMLKLEASCDPYLHFWNALVFEREGEIEKAVEALREAVKVSKSETNSRIETHLNRLGGKIIPSEESVGQVETQDVDVKKNCCVFLNTCYEGFLNDFHEKNPETLSQTYLEHKNAIQRQFFGDSDFYSAGLKKVGWKAEDLIINCPDLQQAWAKENGFAGNDLEICIEQIRRARPQVVYLQNMGMGTKDFLSLIRPYTELIVGQIASPIPQQADISGFDIIFSSFPHFVEKFRKMGVTSYYQPLAFDPRVLEKVRESQKIHPVTFVGGISRAHGKGYQLLEKLAELLPIDIWGYGAAQLPENSPIRNRHHGEAWGLDMFKLLSQSGITINRHIDVAENYANNMRLFEATGCGALLITDYKDNLNELFEIEKEVVAYRSTEECVELVKYYLANPKEAEEIARAGQVRTLRSHTYTKRMEQTAEILERHLRYKREKGSIPIPDMSKISYGHTLIQPTEITESMTSAWKSDKIPLRQRALTQKELKSMYKGETPLPYKVLADCLRPYMHPGCSILEIGCASGYYFEVLEYLLNMRISYAGVDYSEPLIAMARDYYPKATFSVADGALLPFENERFFVAVSSCVLLHVPNYREHIKETVRIAKRFVVAHRTPVYRQRPSSYLKKMAYGVETVELTFNEDEIVSEFIANGLKLIRSHEYYSNPGQDRYEITYIFEKKSQSGLSHEQRIIEKEHVDLDEKLRSGG